MLFRSTCSRNTAHHPTSPPTGALSSYLTSSDPSVNYSICPSPSGWYPDVKWSSIQSNLPRDWKKWDTNSEPWSEVMWDGVPCFENMWVRNSWASSRESMESWVGMKRDCLVRWSTITNIAVCPSDVGSCLMKSIEMDSHGHGVMV